MPVSAGTEPELEERPQPYRALYDHWERTRWSLADLSYEVDRESFEALDEAGRERMLWLFTHRFDGESTVARLMAPFVTAAPDLDVQLLMSTQLVDEFRHVKAIVRIYEEVFGVGGGLDAVQAIVDARRDPVTAHLFGLLERWVAELAADPGEDTYLRAVTAYHVLGEGVIARVSTQLSTPVFERWGTFPGILEGQCLVSRDESRHIGIGVTYVRSAVARDPEWALARVGEVLMDSVAAFSVLLAQADDGLAGAVDDHYGATPAEYYEAVRRLIGIRMRSIGAERLLGAFSN